ncbi:MAG: peptidoglycan DD-metalloendopeptidase family protein [Acetivibrionales bacterium]
MSADTGYKLALPVIGDVSFDYAMDRLVYSKTLEDWRTHSGIDLAADRGTNVKAAADGFISEVKNDPRFGITVIIDHQNGLKTVYANLASDEVVVPNQKVKEGDVIGAIGNTALFESAEQPHLHFEVLMDNRPVDPKEYLPLK